MSSRFARLPDDDILAILYTTPKVAHVFPRRKSLLYGLICLLWLVFGIVGRDPWKPEETLLTAVIADMLAGASAPAAALPLPAAPPLYLHLAAAAAALTAGWLPLHEGARLINILLIGGGLGCLWLAAAQHYGMRAGWLALLLVIGCLGFMVRAHLLSASIAAFFGMALAVLGAAMLTSEQRHVSKTFASGCVIGIAASFLLLSAGIAAAAAAAAALAAARKEQSPVYIVAAAFFLPALVSAWLQGSVIWISPDSRFSSPALFIGALGDAARTAAWSLLPLLPLVICGLWHVRRRRQALDRLLYFCLFAVLYGALLFMLTGTDEEDFYFLLPPLALLAAYLLLKLPDGTASVMDFFALLIIGLGVIGGLWLVWAALHWPLPALSEWLAAALPGYTLPPPSAGKVLAAAVFTIGWGVLLMNFGRSSERAAVNWSCGVTLVWLVFNLLLVGYIDSGKSYRHAAGDLLAVTAGACVSAPDNAHWRAQLLYFGAPLGGDECPYYLSRAESGAALARIARNETEKGYYLMRRF